MFELTIHATPDTPAVSMHLTEAQGLAILGSNWRDAVLCAEVLVPIDDTLRTVAVTPISPFGDTRR